MRMGWSLTLLVGVVWMLAGCAAGGEPGTPTAPGAADSPPHTGVRNSAWEILGMGGGGTTQWPCVSPHDPKIAVQECDMTGGYITLDGANSWRMFNLMTGLHGFCFDPQNKNVIYALNNAVWRSEDLGKTWSMVFPDPKQNTRWWDDGDHAETFLFSDDKSYPGSGREFMWETITVDPQDSKHLLVGSGQLDSAKGVVLESKDYGKTWAPLADLPAGTVGAIYFQPVKSDAVRQPMIFAAAGTGLAEMWADTWRTTPLPEGVVTKRAAITGTIGPKSTRCYIIGGASDKPFGNRLFVLNHQGEQKFTEVTAAFTNEAGSACSKPAESFESVACCGGQGDIAYVGVYHMTFADGSYLNGIAKTEDGGAHWKMVMEEPADNKEGTKTAANYEPSWLEDRMPGGGWNVWFDAPRGLAVAPSDPNICYATDCFRSSMTTDGGKTWQQTSSVKVVQDGVTRWTSRGIDVTNCYGVHFDPFDPKHILLSQTDMGAFNSFDGGKTWEGATTGIPTKWRNTTYWIQFDPTVKGRVWGVFSGHHDLPRLKMYRSASTDRFEGGVAVSLDGGKTWTPSNTGMPETAPTDLVLDPTSPPNARVLYAACFGRGVYKSTDGGKTWAAANTGIEQEKPCAWRLTRAGDGTLYLVVFRRAGEKTPPGTAADGAVYVSKDGAAHWEKLPLPAGCNGPNGITVDPQDFNKLYLSAWARYSAQGPQGGGAYVSADAGQTWKPVFSLAPHVYDLTVDPKNTQVLYVCGFDSGAWRSADGGGTWTKLKGYNFKWGYRVILDPVNADKIYITTFGGGLWHGPALGDPNAVEDVATPIPMRASEGAASPPGPAGASTPAANGENPATLLDQVLELNRMVDPDQDPAAVRKALDDRIQALAPKLEKAQTPAEKVAILNAALLPQGKVGYMLYMHGRDCSLSSALFTDHGNCMAFGTLYVLVGERLNLPLHLASMPGHVFVCWEEGETRINIETTDHGAALTAADYAEWLSVSTADGRLLGFGKALTTPQFLAELSTEIARQLRSEHKLEAALKLLKQAEALNRQRLDRSLAVIQLEADVTLDRKMARDRTQALLKDHELLAPIVRTDALVYLAKLAAGNGDHLTERDYLQAALAHAPKIRQGYVLKELAFCDRALKHYHTAVEELERAMALEGDTPMADTLYALAILQKNDGRLDAALDSIRRGREIEPHNWNLQMLEAGFLFMHGEQEEGLQKFAAIKPPQGDHEFYQDMLAWFYAISRQRDKFYAQFEKALSTARGTHILEWIDQDPDLDVYRKEPEFQALVTKYGKILRGQTAGEMKNKQESTGER